MRKHFTNFILMFILFVGLSLLLYPTASDYWNSHHQTRAITTYADNVAALDHARYEELLEAAIQYNEKLASQEPHYRLSEEEKEEYESTLEVSDTGIMGYIEIPEIDVKLPIYHGTDDAVLQTAVGHLEWTSLPVGGESTHCVISGHRGLPSAKLFTSLDKLREGDTFLLRVLDEVLTYEVDQILIVEPQDTEALQIEEGKDYLNDLHALWNQYPPASGPGTPDRKCRGGKGNPCDCGCDAGGSVSGGTCCGRFAAAHSSPGIPLP